MSLTDDQLKRTRDECQHELKLTGMYEPFSVACNKCGSLHFSEDEFGAACVAKTRLAAVAKEPGGK